jgi:hypothetical protein
MSVGGGGPEFLNKLKRHLKFLNPMITLSWRNYVGEKRKKRKIIQK